jgi:hypothetical protein
MKSGDIKLMGMKNYSSSGYLVVASKLTKLLPESVQIAYEDAVVDGDWEKAGNILSESWPTNFPVVESVFTMDDCAEFDDDNLQRGEMYVQFNEDDLYISLPTTVMINLSQAGVLPENRKWVDFA